MGLSTNNEISSADILSKDVILVKREMIKFRAFPEKLHIMPLLLHVFPFPFTRTCFTKGSYSKGRYQMLLSKMRNVSTRTAKRCPASLDVLHLEEKGEVLQCRQNELLLAIERRIISVFLVSTWISFSVANASCCESTLSTGSVVEPKSYA